MREVYVISDETGPHKGWRRQQFLDHEQRYELFTIDRESEQRSSIRKMKTIYDGDSILHLDCLLTPQAALDIVRKLNEVEGRAFKQGRMAMQSAIKSLLDI